MTKVAIVTTNFNNTADTGDWLASAKTLDTDGLDVLWLVVDNGSDSSIKNIIAKYKGVVWAQTGGNLGFAGGFNRGMKYAKEWGADYVLIMNNDTLFGDKDVLKKMLLVFDKHPKAGLVSPKIYFAPNFEFHKARYGNKDKGKVIWYAGGDFDWDNVRSVHFGIDEVDPEKGGVGEKFNTTEKTNFVSGCCMLIRREVLQKVGYFEEKLSSYYEDNDWIERVKRADYELWYIGSTYIYHKVSRTSKIGSTFTDYLITRNRMWFGMKWAKPRTKFALWREAIRLFIFGRPAQRAGIIDFMKGVWGYPYGSMSKKVEFPVSLSIVIINYKTTKLVLQLLASIFNKKSGFSEVEGGAEVMVLDNSPDEPCKKEVLAVYPNIKFISNHENNGFSAGNNQLISYSLGKHILLLNSDIEVKKNGITNLMKALYTYGDSAIYGGRLFFKDGTLQDSVYNLPTAWHAFEQYFLRKKGSYFMYAPKTSEIVKVEGIVMACFLIPRQVVDKIGGLQEATFMYFEDIEYCRRARDYGIPIYYVPEAEFIHHHGQASKKAGLNLSITRNTQASKWYHGSLGYFMVTAVLWAGQKWHKILGISTTPKSRWKDASK